MNKHILSVERPDLLKEWFYEKNDPICSPNEITLGSNKKVWWKCNKGHLYQQTIEKRTTRNYGCPYCSGKKVLAGFNDLKTLNPDLAKEWDFENNAVLTPELVSLHSNKKVWWKCSKCGYGWKTQVNHRANGRGCPNCAKAQRIRFFRESHLRRGENDLATLRPDLLKEWDYEKNLTHLPEDYTCNSEQKVWWKCSICGNEWQATISNRAVRNSGCPKCMKHERTSFPEQALLFYIQQIYPEAQNSYTEIFAPSNRELDIFIPEINTGIEYDGKAWHSNERSRRVGKEKYSVCKANFIQLIRVSEDADIGKEDCDCFILRNGQDDESLDFAIRETISIISNTKLDINTVRDRNRILKQYITVIKNKSIAIKYPDAVKEWDTEKNDGVSPDMVNATSPQKYWWKCEKGHSYQSAPSNKLTNNYGCPICSGKRLLSGFNDFETKFPLIAKQWDYEKNYPTKPSEIKAGSQVKYWWTCEKGHSYQATPNSRTASNCGCPYCSGKSVLEGYNDLATTNPEMLTLWDFEKNTVSPQSVSKGSPAEVWWKCSHNHSWKKRINSQVLYNSCPICECRELVVGINDLSTTHPELTKEWDYEKNNCLPTQVTRTHNKYVWWKCADCGFSWKQKVNARVRAGIGCPRCGYSKKMQETIAANVVKNKKDLVSQFPQIAAEWDYERNGALNPSKISFGSNKKVWWVCKNGHHYEAWITDRTGKKKTGCPYCAGKRRIDNLAQSNPELVKEWDFDKNDPDKPEDFPASSQKRVSWICPKGHSYEAVIRDRAKANGANCPYCSNKKVLVGYNDLLSKRPDLAIEWHPTKNGNLLPSMVVEGSGKKVWWKCKKCGHEWQCAIVSRTSSTSRGCPMCAMEKRSVPVRCIENGQEFRSVKDAAEWSGVVPSSITICLKGRSKTAAGYHWEYIK